MTTRETIVDRVVKLRTLANHPATSPEEAANAAAQATKLTLKYNLEDEALERAGKKRKDGYTHVTLDQIGYKQYQTLAHYIARANFCEAVILGNQLDIVGQQKNIDLTVYLYQYTKDEIARLMSLDWATRKAEYQQEGVTRANHWTAFWYGALDAVAYKLAEQKRAAQAAPDSKALIVVKDTDLAEAVTAIHGPTVTKQRGRQSVDAAAYRAGFKAGSETNANPALT